MLLLSKKSFKKFQKQQVLFHFISFSFSFSFSRFRCSCSRKSHSRNVGLFVKLDKIAFLSLAERRRKSSSAVVEIVVCFVLLNFRCLFDCNQFQPFSQSNREGVSSSLTNAKNHTFLPFFLEFHQLLRTSRFQTSFHISPFQQSSNQKEERRKQIQNMLCKCGWDFDHFDQFDQNHAFSNHNPKRMTIGFILRELITIWKICKMKTKRMRFHSLFVFIIAEERKEKIVKFSFIFQQTTSIHSHSFNIIKPIKPITIKSRWEWEEEKVKMNIINNHRTSRKPHRLTRAWREGKQTTLTQLPAFPAFCNYLNTRSPPMRIDTPQVTSADRDLSHWCFRRQFNRAMSESGVHDKREYPTRWEMTIHYTANDYSLFKAKQSKAYRRKQSSWDCIACHHSLHPEWAKDLRFAQTGFGVYWLWICLLLSAFSLTSFLQFFFQSIQYSSTEQSRAEGRPSVEVS